MLLRGSFRLRLQSVRVVTYPGLMRQTASEFVRGMNLNLNLDLLNAHKAEVPVSRGNAKDSEVHLSTFKVIG